MTKEYIKQFLEAQGQKNYIINDDLTVDVKRTRDDVKNEIEILLKENNIEFTKEIMVGLDVNYQDLNEILEEKQQQHLINEITKIDLECAEVSWAGRGIQDIPFKFGNIMGNFFVDRNQLTNLNWLPNTITGIFTCFQNAIKITKRDITGKCQCNNIFADK